MYLIKTGKLTIRLFWRILISKPATYKYRGNRSVSRFNVLSEDDVINVTIYNRHWVSQLKLEQKLVIIGKYEGNNKVTASNYYGKPIDKFLGINPIYPLVDKLTQKNVNDSIKKAFNKLKDKIENIIPNEFIIRYRLLNKKDAIRMIHFPKSYNEIRLALRTLKYVEFLKFNVAINLIREANDSTTFNQGKSFNYDDVFVLANNLSFNLTKDQLRSVNEILDDLSSNKIMYRLLQGDVGSGKTLVAALGLYATFEVENQGALLAPTDTCKTTL